jgi:antitoxin YefM
MEFISTPEARDNLDNLINRVTETHTPIRIKGKNSDAILISKEDWEAIQETLYLISIAGMKESIIEGLNTSIEDCTPLNQVEW